MAIKYVMIVFRKPLLLIFLPIELLGPVRVYAYTFTSARVYRR